nr:hypothetical protein BDOA9_0144090 [Bradyrhizobium sp. DOA9]
MIFRLNFADGRTFEAGELRGGTTMMKLQCAPLRLALRVAPPAPIVSMASQRPLQAANDNQLAWPYVPFPPGWYASN